MVGQQLYSRYIEAEDRATVFFAEKGALSRGFHRLAVEMSIKNVAKWRFRFSVAVWDQVLRRLGHRGKPTVPVNNFTTVDD